MVLGTETPGGAWLVGDLASRTTGGLMPISPWREESWGLRVTLEYSSIPTHRIEKSCLRKHAGGHIDAMGKAPQSDAGSRARHDPCKRGPPSCRFFPLFPAAPSFTLAKSPNPPLSLLPSPPLCHRCLWALLTPPLLIKRTPALGSQLPLHKPHIPFKYHLCLLHQVSVR